MTRATFNKSLRRAARALEAEAKHQRYREDPVLWAEEVLGVILWSKQKEILRSIAANKRTAVKSCHSIGKTFTCAIAACWWVSTREDSMVQSTAPTYQQVHSLLWEEIRKMHTRCDLVGRVTLGDQWLRPMSKDGRVKDSLVGEGKKPADSNIHGFHGTHRPDGVFAVLDEGCGIATAIYTGAEAITTASFDRILAVGNPDDPNTEFGRIFREGQKQWNLITVSAFDSPNFTGEGDEMRKWAAEQDKLNPGEPHNPKPRTKMVEQILGSMPQPETIREQGEIWGEESPRYLSKVLAIFPLTSVDSLFTASEIETGRAAVIEPADTDFRVLGVDVARYGEDATVVAYNCRGHIEIPLVMQSKDTMEVAAQIHKLAIEMRIDQIRVDGIGVGGGVVDRLVQLSRTMDAPYVVVEMTANASPPDKALHRNARAYWYDSAKHQLRSGDIDLPVDDDPKSSPAKLVQELGGIRYAYPNGIMKIESKEDIRARGDKSPDYVDAFVMAVAPISYIDNDPLATMRPGQMVEIDVLDSIETISPF